MDTFSPEKRSWLMSKVKSKNTAPEMAIRCALHSMGYRYRIHFNDLPGKPDIAFTRQKKAIFINGCFWHGHDDCRYGKLPKSHIDFWSEKISRNKERDRFNVEALEGLGWKVLVIWECELKVFERLLGKLHDFIEQ